jgi:hypothetical protein
MKIMQQSKDVRQFRVTIPIKLVEALGLENKEFDWEINDKGRLEMVIRGSLL